MSPKLPIIRRRIVTDANGRTCRIEVMIEQTSDIIKYPPEGIKCVFRVFREKGLGNEEFELILLIDNHEPFGFHYHDRLPTVHDSRLSIHISNWCDAWNIFDEKLEEMLNEKT